MMGDIVGKIRDAGNAHPLYDVVEDLDELNVYRRRYHLGKNPNAATEPVDATELQGYVKRFLKVVGCRLSAGSEWAAQEEFSIWTRHQ